MLISVGNHTLSIYWRHHYVNPQTKKIYKKRWTTCIIKLGVGPDSKVLVEAIAKCHKNDEYKKCTGRRISLTEAIRLLNDDFKSPLVLDKEDRRKIWDQFIKTTNCSRRSKDNRKNRLRELREESLEMEA